MIVQEEGSIPYKFNISLFLKVVVGFSALFALMMSILFLISKIMMIKDKLFVVLFYSSLESYHLMKFINTVFNDTLFIKDIIRRLIFNPDLHMMILSIFFITTDNTNVFYILDYLIITAVDSIICFFTYIVPGLKLDLPELQAAKVKVQSPNFQLLSASFEIIVAIYLLSRAIYKHKKDHWLLFIAYFFLVNLSGVITSEVHSNVWEWVITHLRRIGLTRGGIIGKLSESIAEFLYNIKISLQKLYPVRDLKVHIE